MINLNLKGQDFSLDKQRKTKPFSIYKPKI